MIIKIPRTEKYSIGTEYKLSIYKMLESIIGLNKIEEKYENDISKYHPNDIILKHIYVMCRTNAAKLITRKILGLSNNEHDKLANEHIIQFDLYENLKDK